MAWSTIRKATADDAANLEAAAHRFCRRHDIDTNEFDTCLAAVEFAISDYHGSSYTRADDAKRLAPLWRRIVRNTLKAPGADGIAYGTVGTHVD